MYYPMRTYIEEVPIPGSPVSELAVSMVSPDIRNPLIRYKTGDRIKIISYRTLERILAKHARPVPMPRLHMPIVAVFGRKETVQTRGGAIPWNEMVEPRSGHSSFRRSTSCKRRAVDH